MYITPPVKVLRFALLNISRLAKQKPVTFVVAGPARES
jgi:hypothetical protein